MKKKLYFLIFSLLTANFCIFAQYPKVSEEQRKELEEIVRQGAIRSSDAWEKALLTVREEAKNGRPYIPFATRPGDLPTASIPAFPGAEGGGMYTTGGRGGKVYVVTNLNDRGEGSFRWACEQGGARIVVFNVAGIIKLETRLSVKAPYITIAGQTAPGDGVCIAGESFEIDTHDVIIRHMRFRRGEVNPYRRDDALGGNPIGNIIIDHCSTSWGLDENISMYRHMYDPVEKLKDGSNAISKKMGTVNLTIQNTISAEALDTYNHAFGSTLGGENASFMRNLWANNAGRNPSIGWNGIFNFVNNVVFNWVHRAMDGSDYMGKFNIINNYFKPGPMTNEGVKSQVLKADSRTRNPDIAPYGLIHAGGNIVEGNDRVTRDNWDGGIVMGGKPTPEDIALSKWDEPLLMPYMTIMSAQEAFEFVLNNAGANFPKRDAVDERTIKHIRTGIFDYDKNADPAAFAPTQNRRLGEDSYKNGIITDILQVGGYPEYKGTPVKDSDSDGMPDEWERKYGLNPNDAGDAVKDMNGDGYNNIEKYINGIDPAKKTDWTKLENNHDTLEGKKSLL
ncbi:MAG: polysaccharide lyase [Tannerella sp.]|jgi:hypothetical protein|nr:polysaccharide lyase [Tannerella sp.]